MCLFIFIKNFQIRESQKNFPIILILSNKEFKNIFLSRKWLWWTICNRVDSSIISIFVRGTKNTYVWEGTWRDSCNNGPFSGVTTSSFSYHMNQVPFKWQYFNQDIDMLFVGGLIGVSLQKDNSLKPVFGYAVTEAKVQSNPQMK